MLTQHRIPISLSVLSHEWRVWSVIKTDATFYQKGGDRFHLVLTEPLIHEAGHADSTDVSPLDFSQTPRLLWLEVAPHRVTMTMQGNGNFSYRHLWQRGGNGVSRYWLQNELAFNNQLQLRNYTTSLTVDGSPLPRHLRVEYEMWSAQMKLGLYVMNVELNHD
jgi:hypothetical protein